MSLTPEKTSSPSEQVPTSNGSSSQKTSSRPNRVEKFTHADFNGVFLDGGFVNPLMKSKNKDKEKALLPEQNDGISPTEYARRVSNNVPIAGCIRFFVRPPGKELPKKTKKATEKRVQKAAARIKEEVQLMQQASIPLPEALPPRPSLLTPPVPHPSVMPPPQTVPVHKASTPVAAAEQDPNELARKIVFAQTGSTLVTDMMVPSLPTDILSQAPKRRRRRHGTELTFNRHSISSCSSSVTGEASELSRSSLHSEEEASSTVPASSDQQQQQLREVEADLAQLYKNSGDDQKGRKRQLLDDAEYQFDDMPDLSTAGLTEGFAPAMARPPTPLLPSGEEVVMTGEPVAAANAPIIGDAPVAGTVQGPSNTEFSRLWDTIQTLMERHAPELTTENETIHEVFEVSNPFASSARSEGNDGAAARKKSKTTPTKRPSGSKYDGRLGQL